MACYRGRSSGFCWQLALRKVINIMGFTQGVRNVRLSSDFCRIFRKAWARGPP